MSVMEGDVRNVGFNIDIVPENGLLEKTNNKRRSNKSHSPENSNKCSK